MILDAQAIGGARMPLHADLCIAGAGAAGITIARHCARNGMVVLLLESGGMRSDRAGQDLCRGSTQAGSAHPAPHLFRRRGLGGSTMIWGGRCSQFDRHDLAARPWLGPKVVWPIAYDDLAPFWDRAANMLDIGPPDFDARTAIAGGMRAMFGDFRHGHVSTDSIERFSLPIDLGRRHAAELAASHSIIVLLHATCTDILLDERCRRVTGLEIRTRSGAILHAEAANFVLATGGLETPRLLLASSRQVAGGIGNAHGQVGRNYMTHIAAVTGRFTPAPGGAPFHGYERDRHGIFCRRRLSIKAATQEALGIGNAIARLHHPRLGHAAHRSGPLSALYLARRLLPREYAVALENGAANSAILPHIANIVRDAPGTIRFARHILKDRVLASRKYPSIVVAPPGGHFTLDIHAEQLPDAGSRIVLGTARDRFGVPELQIQWRHTEADRRTVRMTVSLIAEALRSGGHGTLDFHPDQIDADIIAAGAYGGHHLGGARMSASPRTGVVDAECRVHGIANLYVAGGAVFPTSSQANPTFMIVSLALRLASRLVRDGRGGRAELGEDQRALPPGPRRRTKSLERLS